MLALLDQRIKVDKYVAYEIDKYAVKTATHNFPEIEQKGDVFDADFTEFRNFDYLMGGSPCTYWSIAQKNNRETEASGLGWELFSQYVRALKEAQPKYFIYENNKSMSNAIRESITETFGFEPICINSALVSAQNRQRLYWVGKRNDDCTYSKVEIEQPEDRGILLKDILEHGDAWRDKSYCIDANYFKATNGTEPFKNHQSSQRMVVAEPVGTTKDGKAYCLTTGYSNGSGENIGNYAAHTLEKGCKSMVAEPVCVAQRGRYDNNRIEQHYEAREDGKTNVLTTVQKDNNVAEPVGITKDGKSFCLTARYYKGVGTNPGKVFEKCRDSMVAEPVCMRYERSEEAKRVRKQYENGELHYGFHELSELHPRTDGKTNTLSTVLKDNPICEPVRVGSLPRPNGELSQSQAFRVCDIEGKSVNLTSGGGGTGGKTGLYAVPLKVWELNGGGQGNRIYFVEDKAVSHTDTSGCMGSNTGLYAVPVEFENNIPVKAMSYADGKTYKVYEVKSGLITIKGKEYPIKLADGYYIIRKLTVRECMRLQTVPEWYDFSVVSNTQAYKMLGNGWTVAVISYLLSHTLE